MRYSNQETQQQSIFDQVIDYCWRAVMEDISSEDTKAGTTQRYHEFWELMSLYIAGDWDMFIGVTTVKKEDINALL